MSPATFTKLFDEHNYDLVGYLRTYCKLPSDAEDVAQETWIRIWQKSDTYDPLRPFKPYLLGAARFAAVDHSRKRKKGRSETKAWREDFIALNRPEYLRYSTEDIEPQPVPRITRKRVHTALRKLNGLQRVRIRKKYWRGYTVAEIAAEEGKKSIYTSMWQANKQFAQYYGEP